MSESSSSGSQGNRSQGSRNRSQGGNRNRSRNRSGNNGGNRSGSKTNAERARPAAPKATGFQKFIKTITFGLVDLTPKRGGSGKGGKAGSGKSSEKRAPRLIEPTSPRLYVGNLNYDATEEALKEYFTTIGKVESVTIITQPGGRSKGFGFIEMESLEVAKNASFSLNDKEFMGRKMLVTGAKPEKKRDDARGGDRRSGGGDRPPRSEGRGRDGGRDGGRSSGGRGRDGRSGGRPSGGRQGSGDRVEKPTRTVKPLEIEVVTSPQLTLAKVNAKATDEDINDLFAGIGTLKKHDAIGEAAEDAVTRDFTVELTDVAEAQKAVEFLHDKTFMGHKISVTGNAAE